jgi:hypothetical protein
MRDLVPLVLATASLVACGSSSDDINPVGADTSTTSDTPASDTSGADSTTSDTASSDTAASDTAASDTRPSEGGAETATDARFDTPGGACGSETCTAGQVCTRTYATGGACMVCTGDDADVCPSGRHCDGTCCVLDVISYSYACKAAPGSCGGTPSCTGACGTALCSGGGAVCEGFADGVITCHILAP